MATLRKMFVPHEEANQGIKALLGHGALAIDLGLKPDT